MIDVLKQRSRHFTLLTYKSYWDVIFTTGLHLFYEEYPLRVVHYH